MKYENIDNALVITTESTETRTLEALRERVSQIQGNMASFQESHEKAMADAQAELDEVNALIDKALELGVTVAPIAD